MSVQVTVKQRRSLVASACVALVFALVAIGVTGRDEGVQVAAPTDGVPASAVESELPAVEFELFDGALATFAEFEGKPLVINFWASWCPACVAELPEFETVHQERGDEVAFLGIANADIRPAAQSLADEVGLTFTLADDPDGVLFREFGLFAMPSTLFVSADGQIIEVFGGQLNEEALNERIDTLVGTA